MKKLRSQIILQRPRWTKVRALFKSMGYSDNDLDRPLIGIANSWNRLVPGHYNLKQVAEYAAQGILQAGGTPVEFGSSPPVTVSPTGTKACAISCLHGN